MASILHIDDDPDYLRLVSMALRDIQPARVISSVEPLDWQELVESHNPDLIILDHHMPGMTGWEVFEALRADEHSMPVLFCTANESYLKRTADLEDARTDCVLKPISVGPFREKVRSLLGL